MKIIFILVIVLSIFACVAWVINIGELILCDFKEPWKGEIIHAIGLIPYASIVTCFFNGDK